MSCDCREYMNQKLESSNAKLAYVFTFDSTKGAELTPPMIMLEKSDKSRRGKLPTLLATFCPFCGQRYSNKQPTAAERG